MAGHPLHPVIAHFPIALLLSATFADVAWLAGITANVHIGAVMLAGGLVTGLAGMGAGLLDFSRLEATVVPHALRHMSFMGIAWIGYAVALYLRRDIFSGGVVLGLPSIALSLVSALLLAFGGWLGGRLVYTFGAGVSNTHR